MSVTAAKKFKKKLATGVVAPGAWNALVARLIVKVGYQAVYVSGGATANSCGVPDIGLLTRVEFIKKIKQITESVDVPVIADADTGYENTPNTVRGFSEAGAIALHIEDQVFPKRCGHLDGKELIKKQDMGKKVLDAKKAAPHDDFMIIARTDARGVTGLDDAIERANYYRSMGADMIFPEGLVSFSEFKIFAKESPGFLLANMTEFGKSDLLTHKQLFDIGYNLIIHPVTTQRVAMFSIELFLKSLLETGDVSTNLHKMQTREDLYKLLSYKPNESWDVLKSKNKIS